MQKINSSDGNFHSGNPATGALGTIVTQPWMQCVQDELVTLVTGAGLPLDVGDNQQVLAAVKKLVGTADASLTAFKNSLASQDGSELVGYKQSGDGAILRATIEKLQERVSVDDFGDVSGGVPDATSAVANALSRTPVGGTIDTLGKSYLVNAFTNPMGKRFVGGGAVLTPDKYGGKRQLNSYADVGKVVIGREYRPKLFKRFKAGGALGIWVYGDSTVAPGNNGGGYAGPQFEPQVLLKQLLQAKGVRNKINITNRGKGGTGIAAINQVPDIDAVGDSSDVFIIKTFINDAGGGLAAAIAGLRSQLTAIRLHAHGGYNDLLIVIVGPNATYESSTARSSPWYESLRDPFVQVAREFQCLYVDAYGYMPDDGEFATGVTMNLDYPGVEGDLRNVHPLEAMQLWIWSLVADAMVSDTEIVPYSSDAWIDLPLQDGWTPYNNGAATPQYRIGRNGDVRIRGVITGGTVGAGRTVAQLPAAAWPVTGELFACVVQSGSACGIRVANDGRVQQADGNTSATYTSLSGICFSTF
ncbi:SGNH/GDSL hydrolase family protein [Burkholderia arboris]|uniref:SGNH/GDSL hydrolase family protein n=1 Tax=Burkholderia arboris TaxID=488730 RepID=UPI00158DCFBD|nr:SGNH/GDSL hydrolase family protein [Burkholderia arboris]